MPRAPFFLVALGACRPDPTPSDPTDDPPTDGTDPTGHTGPGATDTGDTTGPAHTGAGSDTGGATSEPLTLTVDWAVTTADELYLEPRDLAIGADGTVWILVDDGGESALAERIQVFTASAAGFGAQPVLEWRPESVVGDQIALAPDGGLVLAGHGDLPVGQGAVGGWEVAGFSPEGSLEWTVDRLSGSTNPYGLELPSDHFSYVREMIATADGVVLIGTGGDYLTGSLADRDLSNGLALSVPWAGGQGFEVVPPSTDRCASAALEGTRLWCDWATTAAGGFPPTRTHRLGGVALDGTPLEDRTLVGDTSTFPEMDNYAFLEETLVAHADGSMRHGEAWYSMRDHDGDPDTPQVATDFLATWVRAADGTTTYEPLGDPGVLANDPDHLVVLRYDVEAYVTNFTPLGRDPGQLVVEYRTPSFPSELEASVVVGDTVASRVVFERGPDGAFAFVWVDPDHRAHVARVSVAPGPR